MYINREEETEAEKEREREWERHNEAKIINELKRAIYRSLHTYIDTTKPVYVLA